MLSKRLLWRVDGEATERMLALSRQDIGDEVIQAYITQHLSVAYEREPTEARRLQIRERLWEIAMTLFPWHGRLVRDSSIFQERRRASERTSKPHS